MELEMTLKLNIWHFLVTIAYATFLFESHTILLQNLKTNWVKICIASIESEFIM